MGNAGKKNMKGKGKNQKRKPTWVNEQLEELFGSPNKKGGNMPSEEPKGKGKQYKRDEAEGDQKGGSPQISTQIKD